MDQEKMKKIVELVESNEAVKDQLDNSETVNDIVSILNQNGIEVSQEEIINGISPADDGAELDEEKLEQVAGGYCDKGRNWNCFLSYVKGYVKGIIQGMGL